MNRILVTGGAGFVGANLVRQLQADHPSADILVVDDFRVGTFENLVPTSRPDSDTGWSFRGGVIARPLGDIDLYELLERFAPDAIFHEASITDTTIMDEAQMIGDNVDPFEVLLDYSTNANTRLVWASSGATYGPSANGATAAQRPFRIQDAGQPANVYGFSKWIMENMFHRYTAEYPDAKIVGLRYFNVFGPGETSKNQMASMIYQLAQQILDGSQPRIFHDGEQARDHVYVQDVVEATIAGADDDAKTGIYNVGTGTATTFNQLIKSLNQALRTNHEPDYFENPYAFYQDYTCADLTETKKGLNWSPRFTTHDAIQQYASWLKSLRP